MLKAYVIGQIPDKSDVHNVGIEEAEAIVVGGKKDTLLELCDTVPQSAKPVYFISDFTAQEVTELSYLGINALTPRQFLSLAGEKQEPPKPTPRKESLLPARPGGKIIAVGSNKGGVGKTFMSVNIAVALALADSGKKVAIVEFDGEKEELILGTYLSKPPELTVMNYLQSVNYQLSNQPVIKNLYVLPYGKQKTVGINGRMTEDAGRRILESLRQSHDYVIVDMGIFADLWCINFVLSMSDALILVADTGRECVSRLISFMSMQKIIVHKQLVVNRYVSGEGYYSPSDVARILGFDQHYVIPEDAAVSKLMKKKKFPVQAAGTASGKALNSAIHQIFGVKTKGPSLMDRILRFLGLD